MTPKPHYAVDGNKAFGISGTPLGLTDGLEGVLGPFPFPAFWGPMAGRKSTEWIARAAANVIQYQKPTLTLVYLPHLDYDPQRFGPSGTNMPRCVKELDDACAPLLEAAAEHGAKVWVVSEYGHCDVTHPVYPNRVLRDAGWLEVRKGPFGEQLDLYGSRAFAVVDHQLAHVNVRDFGIIGHVAAAQALVCASRAGWGSHGAHSGCEPRRPAAFKLSWVRTLAVAASRAGLSRVARTDGAACRAAAAAGGGFVCSRARAEATGRGRAAQTRAVWDTQ